MIKVLHIVLGLQVGGLERFVLDLVDNYSIDIKPFIVCLETKGELGERCENVDIFEINRVPGISLKTVRQLICLTRQLDIDIIHTHNPGPHFYGALSGFVTRTPVIHTKHGRNYPSDRKKVVLNRISSYLTNKIIGVSRNAAEVSLEVEKIAASKIAVILNGVDIKKFHPAENEDGKLRRLVRVGIVARLSPEKDHSTLLNACRLLANKSTNFHLDIIGDGLLRKTLEKTVKTIGIETFVSFWGVRHDIPELFRQLDIFVLSSTTEGISLTLLEAMATGLPIVATSVGGNPEVVVNGETGYIVPPQNPSEMADKLLLLIDDENLRRQMGGKGRRRVIEKFSLNETVRQYEELYLSLMF